MSKKKAPIFVNITALGITKILLILILFYFLYLIREILAILFVSLVLASAVDPTIDYLQNKRIPRPLGMIFVYLIMFVVIFSAFSLIIPPITEQVNELASAYPFFSEKLQLGINNLKEFLTFEELWLAFSSGQSEYQEIVGTAGTVFDKLSGLVGGIVTFFLVIVITFYMAVEEGAMKKVIWSIAPKQHQIYVMHLVNAMQKKIGLWLRGQLILSLIIFTLTYIGLLILDVKYALVLALIAGLTEFVPYLGPILAAIPAVFLAFTQGGWVFMLIVAALYYIIQLVENNIIVPKLMQKVVGLNPIVSIAVLLIGFELAGIVGAVLSIPVATAVTVVIKDIFERKEEKE